MHCTDDRGQRVKLILFGKLRPWLGRVGPIPAAARQRIYAQASKLQYTRGVLIPLALGLVFTLIWVLGVSIALVSGWLGQVHRLSPLSVVLLFGVVPGIGQLLSIWMIARSVRQQTARIIAEHSYCASCGYALASLPTEADGCTVCPECGSAWRIPAAKDP